jgi:membrane-anchored protein YejM (alkaline phosphatase superfamily)
MTRSLYAISIVRAVFLCLLAASAAFAYYVFGLGCIILGLVDACGEHALLVLSATMAFSLPAILILAFGWWRAETVIKNISAQRDDNLRRFRMTAAVILALCVLMMSMRDPLRDVSTPPLVAMALSWIIVELTRPLANAVRPDKPIAT